MILKYTAKCFYIMLRGLSFQKMSSTIRSALFPGNLGNSCEISCFLRPNFTDHIPQFMPLINHRHYVTFAHMGELIL